MFEKFKEWLVSKSLKVLGKMEYDKRYDLLYDSIAEMNNKDIKDVEIRRRLNKYIRSSFRLIMFLKVLESKNETSKIVINKELDLSERHLRELRKLING